MQPIHVATCSGHLNVISTLVERYGVDPQETSDVCTYVPSLYMCISMSTDLLTCMYVYIKVEGSYYKDTLYVCVYICT